MKGMPGCSAIACLTRDTPAQLQCAHCGRTFCPTHAAQHSCSPVRDGGHAPGVPTAKKGGKRAAGNPQAAARA